MSNIFGIPHIQDQDDNNIKGDCEHYLDHISAEQLYQIDQQKLYYLKEFQNASATMIGIGHNKRIKNKQASYEVIAKRSKALFNYRSLDYYLYRLGIDPLHESVTKFGIELELHELYQTTKDLLLILNAYDGYNSIHWELGCGYSDWVEAGEPDEPEKDKYLREDLGIILC